MKRLLTMAVVALPLGACSENPVAPEPPAASTRALTPGGPKLSSAAISAALDFSADLDGLGARVLPALDDREAADRIGVALSALSDHLLSGDHAAAAGDISLVRAELKPEAGGAADLGNIELVLNLIERSL